MRLEFVDHSCGLPNRMALAGTIQLVVQALTVSTTVLFCGIASFPWSTLAEVMVTLFGSILKHIDWRMVEA